MKITTTPHRTPRILAPDGTWQKYSGVTSRISVLEYRGHLENHGKRHVMAGIVADPDRYLPAIRDAWTAVQSDDPALQREGKRLLDALGTEAAKLAGGDDAASLGSFLHSATEALDAGASLADVQEAVGDQYAEDIAAYQRETAHLLMAYREQRMVVDSERLTGTTDALVSLRRGPAHQPYKVADLKTGKSLDFGYLKHSMQFGAYGHGVLYDEDLVEKLARQPGANLRDVAARARTAVPIDTESALLIWLPAGRGICEVYEVDITVGWKYVTTTVREVHESRAVRKSDILTRLDPVRLTTEQVSGIIKECSSDDELRDLYLECSRRGEWSDLLTAEAKEKKDALAARKDNG